jgi:hypothetical protein
MCCFNWLYFCCKKKRELETPEFYYISNDNIGVYTSFGNNV